VVPISVCYDFGGGSVVEQVGDYRMNNKACIEQSPQIEICDGVVLVNHTKIESRRGAPSESTLVTGPAAL
jgi:hypothetical protein